MLLSHSVESSPIPEIIITIIINHKIMIPSSQHSSPPWDSSQLPSIDSSSEHRFFHIMSNHDQLREQQQVETLNTSALSRHDDGHVAMGAAPLGTQVTTTTTTTISKTEEVSVVVVGSMTPLREELVWIVESSRPPLRLLPEELMLLIFTFLPLSSIYALFQVCKYFHSLAQSDCVWRQQFVNLMVQSQHQLHHSGVIITNGNNQNGNTTTGHHLLPLALANTILPMRQLFVTFSFSKIIQKLQSQYFTLFQNSIQDFSQHPLMMQILNRDGILTSYTCLPWEPPFYLFSNEESFTKFLQKASDCSGLLFNDESFISNPLRRRWIAQRRGMRWILNQLLHNEFVIQCLLVRELLKENVSQNFQIHVKPEFCNLLTELSSHKEHEEVKFESIEIDHLEVTEFAAVSSSMLPSAMNDSSGNDRHSTSHTCPPTMKAITTPCDSTLIHCHSSFPTHCNCFYLLCGYLKKMKHHYCKIDSREYLGVRFIKALKIYQTLLFPLSLVLLILLSMCFHGAYFEFWNTSKADIYILGMIASILLIMSSLLWALVIFGKFNSETHRLVTKSFDHEISLSLNFTFQFAFYFKPSKRVFTA